MRHHIDALLRFYRSAPPLTRFALVGALLSAVWAGLAFGYQFLGPLLGAAR